MHIIKSSKGGGGGGSKFDSWYSSLEDKWVSLLVLLSRNLIIDEVTIALPLQSSLTTSVCSDGKKKTAKKCTAHSEFLFCLCSCFCCHSGSADLASSNTTTLEKMQQNRHPHIPTQRLIHDLASFHNYIIPDCISYQVICMWENKQRLGRQITSTAECGCSFQSLQIITCNIKHLQKLTCTDISPTNTLYWSTAG